MILVQFIKQNKQLSALTLLILLLIPFLFSMMRQEKTLPPTPTGIPVEPTRQASIAPTVFTATTISPETDDPQKKLIDLIQNRRPLSAGDQTAKATILSKLQPGQESGTLYSSAHVSIEYVHAPDLFQATLLTTDIAGGKAEAVAWFRRNEMSQQGICSLPLAFYLDFQIKNQVRSSFNPLPEGC